MPELERFVLHRLAELDGEMREAYGTFDYKRVIALLNSFHDQRPVGVLFRHPQGRALLRPDLEPCSQERADGDRHHVPRVATWIAPILAFTAEEAWLARYPDAESVHLETFPDVPAEWRDDALAERWAKIRRVRRVVTGALEIERAQKRIGASLEAAPVVHVTDESLRAASLGSIWRRSASPRAFGLNPGEGPADAFRLDDVKGVAVVPALAHGRQMRPVVEGLDRCREPIPNIRM